MNSFPNSYWSIEDCGWVRFPGRDGATSAGEIPEPRDASLPGAADLADSPAERVVTDAG
jgi:hypothetical protein